MAEATPDDPHEAHAMVLANQGIAFGAERRFAEARLAWGRASDYADRHLAGSGVGHWIRSGLGSALYDVGDYDGAIRASRSALAWCVERGAVLPSLTIAKSLLALGDRQGAVEHVRQARLLRGDRVVDALPREDRDEMRAMSDA